LVPEQILLSANPDRSRGPVNARSERIHSYPKEAADEISKLIPACSIKGDTVVVGHKYIDTLHHIISLEIAQGALKSEFLHNLLIPGKNQLENIFVSAFL